MRRLLLLVLLPACLAGCLDVRSFEGSWSGAVISEDLVRQGFAAGTRVDPLVLKDVNLHRLSASLTTSDSKFNDSRLTRVTKFTNDTLSGLSFEGDDVRTYLFYGDLASETKGCAATVLISLFSDDHVELRVIRGNDLFGVFHLVRK